MSTMKYGDWPAFSGGTRLTVEDDVRDTLGDAVDDFDVSALVDAYREAINTALPTGVHLAGNDFYGPEPELEPEKIAQIAVRVQDVDLTPLLHRYPRG